MVRKYDWYKMPPSLHIILIHGASIIKNSPLPIGKLSEEALETMHKVVRRYRKHHARTASRVKTNEDVFTRLLINSDPKISKIRCGFLPKKKKRELPSDMKNLLILTEDDLNDIDNYLNESEIESMDMSDESDFEFDSESGIRDL